MIACDTSYPPGEGYPEFCTLLSRFCAPLGGAEEVVNVPEPFWKTPDASGERRNLLVAPDFDGQLVPDAPEVMIYFHTDTAPAGDGWTVPPFTLTANGDRLYGRGAADMKGAIAAVLDALFRLKTRGARLAFRPVLAFCTDEEGGKYPGVRYLAEAGKVPEVILNLNGGADLRVYAGSFGSMNFSLTVTGKAVHSGAQEGGANALEMALPALNALTGYAKELDQRISAMPPPPGAAGPLRSRLSLTSVAAGAGPSAIPGLCKITINRRYGPEENEETVRGDIARIVKGALDGIADEAWKLEEIGHLPPVVDPDGAFTHRWTMARAAAFDVPPGDFRRYGSGTSSDFGWVQRAGVKHILLGGLSRPGRNVHGPDEHTTTGDLNALSKAVELFLSAGFSEADAPAGKNAPIHGGN